MLGFAGFISCWHLLAFLIPRALGAPIQHSPTPEKLYIHNKDKIAVSISEYFIATGLSFSLISTIPGVSIASSWEDTTDIKVSSSPLSFYATSGLLPTNEVFAMAQYNYLYYAPLFTNFNSMADAPVKLQILFPRLQDAGGFSCPIIASLMEYTKAADSTTVLVICKTDPKKVTDRAAALFIVQAKDQKLAVLASARIDGTFTSVKDLDLSIAPAKDGILVAFSEYSNFDADSPSGIGFAKISSDLKSIPVFFAWSPPFSSFYGVQIFDESNFLVGQLKAGETSLRSCTLDWDSSRCDCDPQAVYYPSNIKAAWKAVQVSGESKLAFLNNTGAALCSIRAFPATSDSVVCGWSVPLSVFQYKDVAPYQLSVVGSAFLFAIYKKDNSAAVALVFQAPLASPAASTTTDVYLWGYVQAVSASPQQLIAFSNQPGLKLHSYRTQSLVVDAIELDSSKSNSIIVRVDDYSQANEIVLTIAAEVVDHGFLLQQTDTLSVLTFNSFTATLSNVGAAVRGNRLDVQLVSTTLPAVGTNSSSSKSFFEFTAEPTSSDSISDLRILKGGFILKQDSARLVSLYLCSLEIKLIDCDLISADIDYKGAQIVGAVGMSDRVIIAAQISQVSTYYQTVYMNKSTSPLFRLEFGCSKVTYRSTNGTLLMVCLHYLEATRNNTISFFSLDPESGVCELLLTIDQKTAKIQSWNPVDFDVEDRQGGKSFLYVLNADSSNPVILYFDMSSVISLKTASYHSQVSFSMPNQNQLKFCMTVSNFIVVDVGSSNARAVYRRNPQRQNLVLPLDTDSSKSGIIIESLTCNPEIGLFQVITSVNSPTGANGLVKMFSITYFKDFDGTSALDKMLYASQFRATSLVAAFVVTKNKQVLSLVAPECKMSGLKAFTTDKNALQLLLEVLDVPPGAYQAQLSFDNGFKAATVNYTVNVVRNPNVLTVQRVAKTEGLQSPVTALSKLIDIEGPVTTLELAPKSITLVHRIRPLSSISQGDHLYVRGDGSRFLVTLSFEFDIVVMDRTVEETSCQVRVPEYYFPADLFVRSQGSELLICVQMSNQERTFNYLLLYVYDIAQETITLRYTYFVDKSVDDVFLLTNEASSEADMKYYIVVTTAKLNQISILQVDSRNAVTLRWIDTRNFGLAGSLPNPVLFATAAGESIQLLIAKPTWLLFWKVEVSLKTGELLSVAPLQYAHGTTQLPQSFVSCSSFQQCTLSSASSPYLYSFPLYQTPSTNIEKNIVFHKFDQSDVKDVKVCKDFTTFIIGENTPIVRLYQQSKGPAVREQIALGPGEKITCTQDKSKTVLLVGRLQLPDNSLYLNSIGDFALHVPNLDFDYCKVSFLFGGMPAMSFDLHESSLHHYSSSTLVTLLVIVSSISLLLVIMLVVVLIRRSSDDIVTADEYVGKTDDHEVNNWD